MKRFIYTIAIYFFTLGVVFGQSDDVTLNIRLFPIQIIEVNPSQNILYLDYTCVENSAILYGTWDPWLLNSSPKNS